MQSNELAALRREVNLLKALCAVLLAAVAVVALTAARAPAGDAEFATLRAERIDIVTSQGVRRLVISNDERMPGPVIDGKEGVRSISPAGLVFYDARGNENGGIAITDTDKGKLNAFLFDYDKNEAIGAWRRVTPAGEASAGIMVNEPAPAEMAFNDAISRDWGRILIQNQERNSEILLRDPQGRTRIALRVDKGGDAWIEVLDAEGRQLFRTPTAAASG